MSARSLVLLFAASALALASCVSPGAAEPLKVVASFSVLGDMVRQVAGARAQVDILVGPNGDAHVFQPTPAHAKTLAGADLVVVNGLGFEGWIGRLVVSSGYAGPVLVATTGIDPLKVEGDHADGDGSDRHDAGAEEGHADDAARHGHGDADPHAWQDLANALIYVENIRVALCQADAAGCAAYRANAAAYSAEIETLDAEVRAAVAAVPKHLRRIITSHDAFRYFEAAYGIEMIAVQSASTDVEPSAADVAALIRQIRQDGVRAIFVENIADGRMVEQIARDTGAVVGGEIYSDSLSEPSGPAASYLDMIRHNVRAITRAIGS